jgi:hypothetical protein
LEKFIDWEKTGGLETAAPKEGCHPYLINLNGWHP